MWKVFVFGARWREVRGFVSREAAAAYGRAVGEGFAVVPG